jgi:lipopolysaccharide/colanic/teichoic acid biosynthesis glycosyltransferase
MGPPISRVYRNIPLQPAASVSARSMLGLSSRIRVQLGGAVVICVLLPAFVRWYSLDGGFEEIPEISLRYAALGTLFALLGGYVLLRQFITYPGVNATSYIVPSFAASYAAAALVFFFMRIDYSRWQFGASFALAVLWFSLIYSVTRRYAQPRLGLIPGGNDRQVTRLLGAKWVLINEPPEDFSSFDGFVADLRAEIAPNWQRFLAHMVLNGWPVYDIKQVSESLTGRVEIEHLSENSFGSVLPSLMYLRLKRIIDVTAAAVVLPVFLLVIGIAAICIRLETRGPALFKQSRMGFRAQIFTCYKLRSMHMDVEGTMFTADDDKRVTKVGRYLRKYRIDEFPQIWNILMGEMSWIGPRPEAVELATWYESEVPFYAYRHAVRPGISGWAQVQQGNVAELAAATSKLHYDFYYIKHFSLWLDALIVAMTLRTMFTGFGSK